MPEELEQMTDGAEAVYDEQIFPLMKQLIEICKEHKIPMVASFEYEPKGFCTSAVPFKGQDGRFESARTMLFEGYAAFAFRSRVVKEGA